MSRWRKASRKVRIATSLALVSLPLCAMLWQGHQSAQASCNLYPYPLSSPQIQEISQALSGWGIAHILTPGQDNLQVSPQERPQLLVKLSMQGLPHRGSKPEQAGFAPPKEAQQVHQLEQGLEESIRSIHGVREAKVTLALADNKVFNDGPPTSASVFIAMQPEQQLTPEQGSGVAHMVASAVPGLDDANVSIVDDTGKALARKHKSSDDFQIELQKQLDSYLSEKAQTLLDNTYGKGRASVTVNADFDFSQMEIHRTNVGKPGAGESVVVEQKVNESYRKPHAVEGLEDQMVGEEEPAKKADSTKYDKVCEARRFKNDEALTFTVYKIPRVRRITSAVSISIKGQEANVRALMLGALGIDDGRGDYLGIATVPGVPPVLAAVPNRAPSAASAEPPLHLWTAFMILPGLAFAALWALRRKRTPVRFHAVEVKPCVASQLEDMARERPLRLTNHLRTLFATDETP